AQKYVEIAPRNGGAELQSGASIQSDSTLSPVDFDQFLSALDPQTRARLQTLIQQAGGGLQGQQETINDLLSQLNGLSQESVAPLSTFHQHDPDLDRIVANLGVTSDRLSQSHQQLGDLVASMGDVTGTLAQNDKALAALLTHLGNVMGDFDATLAGNEQNFHTTVVTLDPLLTELNGTLTIVAAVTAIAAEVPALTVATKAADADAVAAPLPDDFPTRRPDTAMHTGTDAAKAAHAEPEPLHLPVGSGIGPAAGHPSRLVEHP